jgi:hypothetical protein
MAGKQVSEAKLAELRQRGQIDETVSTAEAAALLGLLPQTLRNWSSDGDGPIKARRVNGRLRWALEDVRKLLNGEIVRRRPAAPPPPGGELYDLADVSLVPPFPDATAQGPPMAGGHVRAASGFRRRRQRAA